MPLPKEWLTKPRIRTIPFRINGEKLCHNCFEYYPVHEIKTFSGMCITCEEMNSFKKLLPIKDLPGATAICQKCKLRRITNTNIGIVRDSCNHCSKDNILIQRCVECDKLDITCWNHICQACRIKECYFCEKEGFFFPTTESHNNSCICRIQYEISNEVNI